MSLTDLIGREVDFDDAAGEHRHGTIRRATWSMSGETVLVLHPDCRGCEVPADTVVFGRKATEILGSVA